LHSHTKQPLELLRTFVICIGHPLLLVQWRI